MKPLILLLLCLSVNLCFAQNFSRDSVLAANRYYVKIATKKPVVIGRNLSINGVLKLTCNDKSCLAGTKVYVAAFKKFKFYDGDGREIWFNPYDVNYKITEGATPVLVNPKYESVFLGRALLNSNNEFNLSFFTGSRQASPETISPTIETRIYYDRDGIATDDYKIVKSIRIVYELRIQTLPPVKNSPCIDIIIHPVNTVTFSPGESKKNIGPIEALCIFYHG